MVEEGSLAYFVLFPPLLCIITLTVPPFEPERRLSDCLPYFHQRFSAAAQVYREE
jgi:hypothetical protein